MNPSQDQINVVKSCLNLTSTNQQQRNNQSQSLLSQLSNDQLQQLGRAPTLEGKDQLITKFKLENEQAQEVQRQLDEVRESLERIQRPSSRFGRGRQ